MNKYPLGRIIILLITFTLIYGIGLTPSIAFQFFITTPLRWSFLLTAISLLVNFLILIISELLISCFFIRLLNLNSSEGKCEVGLHDNKFFKFTLFQTLYNPVHMLLYFMHVYKLKELQLRLLGAKIGKNVSLGGRINDPSLFEVGDNTVIAGMCEVLTHSAEKGILIFKKVKIGNNCTLGQNSIILPGAIMEDNSVVGSMSLVPKNKKIPKGQVWGGVPARKIK